MLDFWDGEWQFWAEQPPRGGQGSPPPVNVVLYTGPAAARACILEHEAWLDPASADGKAIAKVGGMGSRPHQRFPLPFSH